MLKSWFLGTLMEQSKHPLITDTSAKRRRLLACVPGNTRVTWRFRQFERRSATLKHFFLCWMLSASFVVHVAKKNFSNLSGATENCSYSYRDHETNNTSSSLFLSPGHSSHWHFYVLSDLIRCHSSQDGLLTFCRHRQSSLWSSTFFKTFTHLF